MRTVQNALRHAERIGLISIAERRVAGRRNLPNVVRVVSKEWLAWIEHHAKAREQRGIGCRMVQATDSLGFSKGLKGQALGQKAHRESGDHKSVRTDSSAHQKCREQNDSTYCGKSW